MSHRLTLPAALAALTLCLAAVPAPAQTTLRYKFKEGETLRYLLEQRVKSEVDSMGKKVEVKMAQTFDITWKVAKVDGEGNAEIVKTFDRIRLRVESPSGGMEVDSQSDKKLAGVAAEVLGPRLQALAEAKIVVAMTPTGEITDVRFPEALEKVLNQPLPGGPGAGPGLLSVESLKGLLRQARLPFPEQAVTKGDSWSEANQARSSAGTAKAVKTFTYQGPAGDNGLQKVGVKTAVEFTPEAESEIKIEMEMKRSEGEVLFDNAAGRIVSSTGSQLQRMRMNFGGQDAVQDTHMDVSMKLQGGAGE